MSLFLGVGGGGDRQTWRTSCNIPPNNVLSYKHGTDSTLEDLIYIPVPGTYSLHWPEDTPRQLQKSAH